MKRDGRPVSRGLRRGVYLLPSLFTIGNIFLGFYALSSGFRGDFERAALLLFAAGFLDNLDGRIARLTRTESAFGREFDSLADVITFGVMPALLAWEWGLDGYGRLGWLMPLFFTVCTATRLARFNVQTKVADSRFFVGLPCPAAAGAVGSLLFLAPEGDGLPWLRPLMLASLAALGTLMVSTVRYPSFKKLDLARRRSYRILLPLAAVTLVVAYHPQAFFLTVAVLYTFSGPVSWIVGRLRPRALGTPAPHESENPPQ